MTEKRDDFDSPWKTVIEEYFEEFMVFFFPDAHQDIDWTQDNKRENIIKLFHFIDWIMKLPADLESSFWAELQELEEVKRMRYISSVERIGMVKGMQQGMQQGAVRSLLRLLEHRFEPAPEEIQKQLQTLTVEQVEQLVDVALAVNSIAEFAAQLPRQASHGAEALE